MTERREKPQRPLVVEVVARVAIVLVVIAVVTHTLVRPFVVPSASMEPTIDTGDRVVAQVVGVDEDDLDRGDVAAFGHGTTWEADRIEEPNPVKNLVRYGGDLLGVGPSHTAHTVKRVVGLPGEKVECCDDQGRILVDGEPLDEPYVRHDLPFEEGQTDCSDERSRSQRCFPEVTVPEGSYLMLGDNRANSADSISPCRGQSDASGCAPRFVRAEQVVGVLGWRMWPLPPGSALRD